MNKQSIYNIWVENILYNSLSNQLISFKDNEMDSISHFLENLEEFEKEYPDLFEKFMQKGFIIKSDFDELDYIYYQNKKEVFLNKNYRLTINPTLDCNYHCWYCCVEDAGTKYEPKRMDDTIIQKVNNHLQYMVKKDSINSLQLDWFGGEPLMYFKEVIYPISKLGLKLSAENNIPFSNHATTNAYYIDDAMIKAFNEIHMNSFQIPIDGHERKHNSVKNMENIGHYRQIIKNVNALCEQIDNIQIVLRINYDTQTLKTILPVIEDIKANNRKKIFVDFQRVWQVALSKDESGNNALLLKTKEEFENAGFNTIYFAFNHKGFKCCYADSFYHRVINYDGKIFKCTARDYSDDLVIGNLNDDGRIVFNENILSKMFGDATFKNEKCLKCKILPLCYGSCIQKYYEIKTGKKSFSCLYESSEISFEKYIKDKAFKQINLIRKFSTSSM